MSFDLKTYDYELPEELIAQEPLKNRSSSKLMVVDKKTGQVEHKTFADIASYFQKGDVLVLNETKVIPARLYAKREGTGSKLEIFLLRDKGNNHWEALTKPGRKAKPGTKFYFDDSNYCVVKDILPDGVRLIEFFADKEFSIFLDDFGEMPLPPYINRRGLEEDKTRYQTVFAKKAGAVAAPTASLHFTPELLKNIENKGVKIVKILLHVGIGTFRPVKVEDLREHEMHSEYYEISEDAAKSINNAKENGGKVIAVGTTVVRTLETAAKLNGKIEPSSGDTDIFIYPGYQYKIVDNLITNFHLPKSTLLMLVSAFSSIDIVKKAYQIAVEQKYRFFSYGDAMLFL